MVPLGPLPTYAWRVLALSATHIAVSACYSCQNTPDVRVGRMHRVGPPSEHPRPPPHMCLMRILGSS